MLNSVMNGDARTGNGSDTIRFGVFEADLHTGELRKSGNRIKLQDQPFKVLQILLERPGNLVTREELQNRIWPNETYGDFDHAVNVAVGKLRTALGDSADNPSFVETVPRRGYRFVGVLENTVIEIVDTPAPPPPPSAPPAEPEPPQQARGHKYAWIAACLLIMGTLLAAGIWWGRRTAPPQLLD